MPFYVLFLLRVLSFVVGFSVVLYVLISVIRTFVLPRSAPDRLVRIVFIAMRRIFDLRISIEHTYERRDEIMALYAPFTLILLPAVWLACVLTGYMAMFWATTGQPLYALYKVSGSSLFTLGYAVVDDVVTTSLIFTEAAIGLFLVALLIAYLPTMYAAFAKREAAVTMLEVRAGSPPSAIVMLTRFHHLGRLDKLGELWVSWEQWFVDIDESHTSLAALPFFRSPQANRSWVTAAGAVLDTAALVSSTIDIPKDAQADLCIRAGFLALRHISDFFGIPYDPNPQPDGPISVTREEFDAAYDTLAEIGLPLKPDREKAWRDFRGWRVNYDTVLLHLAGLTMAPEAPWSSDRAIRIHASFKLSRKKAS
ncbi:MAG: hypothetical protein NVS4B11_22060 [Ktedonobacteraceae bacterium]